MNNPSLTWLAPGCDPLAEGAYFCPAIANRLVSFCEVSDWWPLLWAGCGELWLKTAIHIFPSVNKTDRSWFIKLNLCRKVDLWERERGLEAFCPSLYAGKVCSWEKKQGEPQWYSLWYFLLLLLSRGQTREHPGLSSNAIDDDAALPPCFLCLLYKVACSPLYSHHVFALPPPPPPKAKIFLKGRIITVWERCLMAVLATAGFRDQYATCSICFPSSVPSCPQHIFPQPHPTLPPRKFWHMLCEMRVTRQESCLSPLPDPLPHFKDITTPKPP